MRLAIVAVLAVGAVGVVMVGLMVAVTTQAVHYELDSYYCHHAYYNNGIDQRVIERKTCHTSQPNHDGYHISASLDKEFYRQGDMLLLEMAQDPADPLRAVNATVTITRPYPLDNYHTITIPTESDKQLLQIKLDKDTFKYVGGHRVKITYDTGRDIQDQAYRTISFGLLPETTGVQGKVYQDTNGNGRLDAGEPGVEGLEVIAVMVTDHSYVKRAITDNNGDYFIEIPRDGDYLVQVIGGGTQGYKYVRSVYDVFGPITVNLIP